MQATVTKIQDAQPIGAYQPTGQDAQKAAAEFLLIEIYRNSAAIKWASGAIEFVTDRKLAKLQADHTWATDF